MTEYCKRTSHLSRLSWVYACKGRQHNAYISAFCLSCCQTNRVKTRIQCQFGSSVQAEVGQVHIHIVTILKRNALNCAKHFFFKKLKSMKQTGRIAVSEADCYDSMLLVPDMAGTGSGHRFLPWVDFMTHW